MNAPVQQVSGTKSSTTLDKLDKAVLISKRAWYKEAAGFVAVMSWFAIIAINTWAIFANTIPGQPIFLGVLYFIALGASALRNASTKIDIETMEL